ncbi:hypothetical protein KKF61_09205 [Patescibacteria group bacterium]|nr:hypothetical protein [Patescibacteria group bacterium]
MGKKLPFMKFYTGDWLKDPGVQSLDWADQGRWIRLLCFMWESEERGKLVLNGEPMTEEVIGRLMGEDKGTLKATLERLLNAKVLRREDKTEIYFNARMVRDEEKNKTAQEHGKKGGNPNLVNPRDKGTLKGRVKGGDKAGVDSDIRYQMSDVKDRDQKKESVAVAPGESSKKSKPQSVEPSPEAWAAAWTHWNALVACGVKVDRDETEWRNRAATEYDRAFKNGWAKPSDVDTVMRHCCANGFWHDKITSPAQIFKLKDDKRKFTTILNQAKANNKPRWPDANAGMVNSCPGQYDHI